MSNKKIDLRQGSTIFLKLGIVSIALIVVALCVFALPHAISSDVTGLYSPILFGMYVTAVPFFFALYQGLIILKNIEKNKAFSVLSIKALRYVKYCAMTIGSIYAVGIPYIFIIADIDDAPGVIVLAMIIIFTSFVIAASAGVFQKLLQSAIEMKSENDLTV